MLPEINMTTPSKPCPHVVSRKPTTDPKTGAVSVVVVCRLLSESVGYPSGVGEAMCAKCPRNIVSPWMRARARTSLNAAIRDAHPRIPDIGRCVQKLKALAGADEARRALLAAVDRGLPETLASDIAREHLTEFIHDTARRDTPGRESLPAARPAQGSIRR